MNCNEYPVGKWVTPKNRLPAFRRMHALLELATNVEADLNVVDKKVARVPQQTIARLGQLNRALARYTFKAYFPDPPRFFLTWRFPGREKVIPSEHRAILSLLRLLELRLLHRLKSCAHCSTWFFARYKHSKFCKNSTISTCQQKYYASSAEFKDERRTYMREYRRSHPY